MYLMVAFCKLGVHNMLSVTKCILVSKSAPPEGEMNSADMRNFIWFSLNFCSWKDDKSFCRWQKKFRIKTKSRINSSEMANCLFSWHNHRNDISLQLQTFFLVFVIFKCLFMWDVCVCVRLWCFLMIFCKLPALLFVVVSVYDWDKKTLYKWSVAFGMKSRGISLVITP